MKSQTRSIYDLLAGWREIVADTPYPQPPAYLGPDVMISSFVEHSDQVQPGTCFVARVRTGTDGHPYIKKALENGASLIIGQRRMDEIQCDFESVPYLEVEDSALAEAWLAASFYRFPSRRLFVIGVTGTDGKTTTTNLIYHILHEAGVRTGMLSTLKAVAGDKEEPLALHVTTPEAPVVQAHLKRMVDLGLTHCVLEATSHGLAQDRVAAVDFDMAVLTNITHEHLDYHGDYQSYFSAKAKLFYALTMPGLNQIKEETKGSNHQKTAVLNADDSSFCSLASIPIPKMISYAIDSQADVVATDVMTMANGTQLTISMPGTKSDVPGGQVSFAARSTLVGKFNISNILAAVATVNELSIDKENIKAGLRDFPQLTGRMESIDRGQPFQVIVDFAHTPNGLERAIEAARGMVKGRIITVFGSAGKRDVKKRTTMAEIAARLADLSILTAEDPRTDSLESILATMARGFQSQGSQEGVDFWRITDRGQAIHFAISLARAGDLVLICGKGHEQSMCFGTTEYPWDDIEAARMAIDAIKNEHPMPDLGLPSFDHDFVLPII